jgi:hypothetical protein
MSAIPFVVNKTMDIKVQFYADAAKTQEIVPTEQVLFDTDNHAFATASPVGLSTVRVTPVGGNPDGTPANVNVLAHLPASAAHSAFDATQAGIVQQIPIVIAVFTPL